ncbi:MAG: VOC family protein [Tumebacillaceae bacterium]
MEFETHGVNHITLFVRDLEVSLKFYTDILRMKVVRYDPGDYAYLESGMTWFAIAQKPIDGHVPQRLGVSHMALTVREEDFETALEHLRRNDVKIVREPIIRGMGKTVNFLDPDGVEWEFHTSNLAERMTVIEEMERNKRV